jgi:hypothetical protein
MLIKSGIVVDGTGAPRRLAKLPRLERCPVECRSYEAERLRVSVLVQSAAV